MGTDGKNWRLYEYRVVEYFDDDSKPVVLHEGECWAHDIEAWRRRRLAECIQSGPPAKDWGNVYVQTRPFC